MPQLDFVSFCGGRPLFGELFSALLFGGLVNDLVNQIEEVVEALRHVFRRALCSSLGESAGKVILSLLGRDLGRDPFEVLWEDPKAFYSAMERVLGVGAKVLISILIMSISNEFGLNMNPELLLEPMRSGSVKEVQSFLRKIAESCMSKGDDVK